MFFAPQDSSKNGPRSPQDGLEEVLFRCSISSSILVRFGSLFGPILGPQIVHFGGRFLLFLGTSRQEAPKRLPRGPQEPPRGAKRLQKVPQEAPKSPPRGPKRTQEHPKGHWFFAHVLAQTFPKTSVHIMFLAHYLTVAFPKKTTTGPNSITQHSSSVQLGVGGQREA